MSGLRLLVIGKQGSGKGTLSAKLAQHFDIPHISTGDILRAAVQRETPLGVKAQSYMQRGELLPDEIVIELVGELFVQDDLANKGFVFDGFPRTMVQADGLDRLLAPGGIDTVINLEVSTDLVVQRISSRRVCTNAECATIYSLSVPPKVNWTCDVCGGPVEQREDDTEESVMARLSDYERLTAPLIDRYQKSGKLLSIDGSGSPDEVFQATRVALDGLRPNRSTERR